MGAYWWRVPLLSFFLNISSLHLLGLHSIWLFILQLRNWFTVRSADVSESFHTGATIVESSAYLKSTGVSFIKTSRSLRKILNKYGSPTLPCVVPLLAHTQSQEWPLTEMHCCLLLKKLSMIPINYVDDDVFALFWNNLYILLKSSRHISPRFQRFMYWKSGKTAEENIKATGKKKFQCFKLERA